MSRIEVQYGSLRAAGSRASSAGSDVGALAGDAQSIAAAGAGAPPATGAALEQLAAAWGGGLGVLAFELGNVGTSADAAASLYETVDTQAIGALP
jgi:hypothetical protein